MRWKGLKNNYNFGVVKFLLKFNSFSRGFVPEKGIGLNMNNNNFK